MADEPTGAQQALDRILLEDLWPGVVRAVRGSGLTTWTGSSNTLADGISTPSGGVDVRDLTFLLDDPARPVSERAIPNPPWFSRLVITVKAARDVSFDVPGERVVTNRLPLSYMVNKQLTLSFPDRFPLGKLTRFLKEPLMQGCPPALTWNEHRGEYLIHLDTGSGDSLFDGESARRDIRQLVT